MVVNVDDLEIVDTVGGAGGDVLDHVRSARRPIAGPQLATVHTVVGDEEDARAAGYEVDPGRLVQRRLGARANVEDHLRPRGGAVGDPQLAAVVPVVGGEEDELADPGQVLGIGMFGVGTGKDLERVDVLEQAGAGLGTIRDERLDPPDDVAGDEDGFAVQLDEIVRVAVQVLLADDLDEARPALGPVATKQLAASPSIRGREQRDVAQLAKPYRTAGVPKIVGDHQRPGRRPVGAPQLTAGVASAEQEHLADLDTEWSIGVLHADLME